MEKKQINCTNVTQRVMERDDMSEETKVKLLKLINDFEVQYKNSFKSFDWNTL